MFTATNSDPCVNISQYFYLVGCLIFSEAELEGSEGAGDPLSSGTNLFNGHFLDYKNSILDYKNAISFVQNIGVV